MKLNISLEWLQKNARRISTPRGIKDGVICWVQGQAILIDDTDTREAYLEYCNYDKSWWLIPIDKLENIK